MNKNTVGFYLEDKTPESLDIVDVNNISLGELADGFVDMEFNDVSIRNNAEKYFTRIGGGRKFSFMSETTQPGTVNGRRVREMEGEICVFA